MVLLLSERINAVLKQYSRSSPSDRPSTCPCPPPRRLMPSTPLQPEPYACCPSCPARRQATSPTSPTRQPRKLFCPTDIPCPAKARNQIKPSCPKDFPCPGHKQYPNRSQTIKPLTCPNDVPCLAKRQPQTHYKPFILRECPANAPCPAKIQTDQKANSYPTKKQTMTPFTPCPAKWQTNPAACSCPSSRKTFPGDVPGPAILSTLESFGIDERNAQYGNAENKNYAKPKCGNPNCFPKSSSPVRNRTTIGSYSSACPPPNSLSFPKCPACLLSPGGGQSLGGISSNVDGCPLREVVIRGDGEHKEAFIKKSWPEDVGGGMEDRGKGEGECHCVADTLVTRGLALYSANQNTRPPPSPAGLQNSQLTHSKPRRSFNVNPTRNFNKSTPSPSSSRAIPPQCRGPCRDGKIKPNRTTNATQSKRPTVTYAKSRQSPSSLRRVPSKTSGPSRDRRGKPNRSSKFPLSQSRGRFGKLKKCPSKCSSVKSRGRNSKPRQKQSTQVKGCHCIVPNKPDSAEELPLRVIGSDSTMSMRSVEEVSAIPSTVERRCCPQCRGNSVAKNPRLTTIEEGSKMADERPVDRDQGTRGNGARPSSPARPNQVVPKFRCEIRVCSNLDEKSPPPQLSFQAVGNGRYLHDRQNDEASTRVLYKRNQKPSGLASEAEKCYCSRCFV